MRFSGEHTERLVIRSVTSQSANWWSAYFQDEKCMQHMKKHLPVSEKPHQYWVEKQLLRYQRDGFGLYALELISTGELIGQCGPLVQEVDGEEVLEIGYHLLSDFWGKGYAAEAARYFRKRLFEDFPECKYVVSIIDKENTNSQRVAKANGMEIWKETLFHNAPVYVYRVDR